MTIRPVRNIPSDASPAIVALAVQRRTGPEFVPRAGFVQCPRCRRFWPESDYRPDHASFGPERVHARCRTCRLRLSAHQRDEARRTGLCEASYCDERQHRDFKCRNHYDLSVRVHAERTAARTAPAPDRT
jgi:hypothetical protein